MRFGITVKEDPRVHPLPFAAVWRDTRYARRWRRLQVQMVIAVRRPEGRRHLSVSQMPDGAHRPAFDADLEEIVAG